MYSHMVDVVALKVTASGQISLPAHLRRRWQVDEVLVVDKGDYALVRPVPRDPVAQLRGSVPATDTSMDDIREQERTLEARVEQERWSS
jgi:bifunctional DNA-binding transcriptional regulator/antitoxin component of YhaV-PrlF toxin-antitoxin module